MLIRSQDNFNSQPHEEADFAIVFPFSLYTISTHSLTKRLTMMNNQRSIWDEYFNSQPHEEADSCSLRSAST